MVTMHSFRNSLLSGFGLRQGPPDAAALKALCLELLADVAPSERRPLLHRLERMRRADDLPHLRGALFDVISHAHGEGIARERLVQFDARVTL